MNRRDLPRILVVTSTFPRWPGDATPRFVHDLAVLASDAFDVTVLAPHHPGALRREQMGPLRVIRFAYFVPTSLERLCYEGGILPNLASSRLARAQVPAFAAAELHAIRRLLAEERFDLVHAHWLVPQGVLAALATARAGTPLVVSAHGSDLFALRGRLFDGARRWLGRHAAAFTSNSDATHDALVRAMPWVRPHALPMGIDERLLSECGATADDARRGTLLLFVGRLSRQKGVHVLLEAMAMLAARGVDARAEIVGDGPERASLERRARQLRLDARVTFAGACAHDEVVARMQTARAFVFPARAEGQGLAVIEAMACGCPVVASRSGALGALLGEDARGLGVPDDAPAALADAVARVFAEPGAAAARARAARAFVAERYTLRAIAPRLNALYRGVLEGRAWA